MDTPPQSPDQPPSPPPPEPVPPAPAAAGPPSADEKQWAMLCHLGGLVGHLLPSIGHIIAPLVLWLIRREKWPFVDQQGKESLNFQISVTLYALLCWPLIPFCGIGLLLLIPLGIFDLIVVIMACIAASEGRPYRYPLCIRFIQ